jgi:hypothetical protein
MSGDLLRCRRALVKLERGAVRSPSLKFTIEKDNICELGELAKSAHGSTLNRPAAPALQPSIAPSDAAWCDCGRSDLLDLETMGYSVSVAQRGSGADSTGAPCVYFCRAWSRWSARCASVNVCGGRQQSRFFDEYACPAPGSIAHTPGTDSQALETVRFDLQRLTVCGSEYE